MDLPARNKISKTIAIAQNETSEMSTGRGPFSSSRYLQRLQATTGQLLFSVVGNGQEHLSRGNWKIGICYHRMLCRGDAFNLNRPCQNEKHTKKREVTEKKNINNFLESEV